MYKVKNLKIISFFILLRGLYAPSFPDRGVLWKVLQVHGQGGHGLHEDPPDEAAHQHAQNDRGIKTSAQFELFLKRTKDFGELHLGKENTLGNLHKINFLQVISVVVSCPTYQSFAAMKKESTLESVKKADSDSDLSDYLVPVCLIITVTVIVTMALCMARNIIRGTINTVRTVIMGQQADVNTDSGELGKMIKTDDNTEGLNSSERKEIQRFTGLESDRVTESDTTDMQRE